MPRPKTPNMGLILPESGVDSRADSDRLIVEAFERVDTHNHDSSQGREVPSDRLSVRSNLALNNKGLDNANYLKFADEEGNVGNLSLYVLDGDLYYKDANGVAIKLTNAGRLNTHVFTVQDTGPYSMYYGFVQRTDDIIARISDNYASHIANIKNSANDNVEIAGNRYAQTVNSLLLGSLLNINAPSGRDVAGFYHLWVALLSAHSGNLEVYTLGYERETEFWEKASNDPVVINDSGRNIVNVSYRVFIRNIPYAMDDSPGLIFRNFEGAGGVLSQSG